MIQAGKVFQLALIAGLLAGTASAGSVSLVTSSAALGANDFVLWSQLGSDNTTISNPISAISSDALAVTGSLAGTNGLIVDVGASWGPPGGLLGAGDAMLWAFDNVANTGTGPVTLSFPTGFGAGAAIQADVLGAFTAQIQLFDGSTSLGTFTETSTNGDAIFIGALDTTAEVTKAVFSLTAAPSGNGLAGFAIDTLYLQDSVVTPEPGSIFMLVGGLAAISLKLRRRAGAR